MNLAHLLIEQAGRRPNAPALVQTRGGRDQVTSFGELAKRSDAIAAQLRAAGVGAGDAVLLLVPMSADLYAALVGLFRIGAVAMVLDPSAGLDHLARCCALQAPSACVAVPKAGLLWLASRSLRAIPRWFRTGGLGPGTALRADGGGAAGVAELADAAPALLTFTSGSTGQPKAVVRSHGFLLAQHRALAHSLALQAGEVDLTTLPVFALANLASGVTSVIPDADLRRPGFIDSGPVLEQVRRLKVTRTAASPAFVERLLDHPAAATHAASLRQVYTGGAPVFPRLLEQVARVWPDCLPVAVYGSTEAEPIAHVAWPEMAASDRDAMRRGAGLVAGVPVPELRLAILRAKWGEPIGFLEESVFTALHAAVDEAGEIVVSGDHVVAGYLHGQGDAETKFRVAGRVWHRTGDVGRMDARGRLWLLGRCSARIQDAAGELHPFAVECVALEHAGVRRAGCVAVAGRRVLAVEGTVDIAALQRELAWARLADIQVLDHLPVDRRHNAKIDYAALRRTLSDAASSC